MTEHQRKLGAADSTTKWPYHSETHDNILWLMGQNSGPAPLPPHVQNAHALAEEHTHESLSDNLELAEQRLAETRLTLQALEARVSDLRLARELHLAAQELPV